MKIKTEFKTRKLLTGKVEVILEVLSDTRKPRRHENKSKKQKLIYKKQNVAYEIRISDKKSESSILETEIM